MTGRHIRHTTKAGERWDQLAWRFYRNVSLQGQLIHANRALFSADLKVPAVLGAGMVLKIPVIEKPPVNAERLPPWKQP